MLIQNGPVQMIGWVTDFPLSCDHSSHVPNSELPVRHSSHGPNNELAEVRKSNVSVIQMFAIQIPTVLSSY